MSNGEAELPLRHYRLYHVCDGGGIEAVSILETTDHTKALKRAQEMLETSSGELWLDDEMMSAVRRGE